MNRTDLLVFGLEVLAFLMVLLIGWKHPRVPLIAFAWVAPYLAGNLVGTIYFPFAPARSLGLGLVVLAVSNRRIVPTGVDRLRKRVYLLLGIAGFAGLVGICLVYARAEYIGQFRQTPEMKVLRATGSEVLRWLLLIVPATLAWRGRLSQKLIRHVIFAGLFYCALGLVQFGMEQTIGYDPFPMVREGIGDSGHWVQSTMNDGLDARINSICGEPRYLAAYCCLWFLLTAAMGKRVGFSRVSRMLIASTFLLTMVMTGSRTGLLILATTGVVAGATALFSGRLRLAMPILTVLLLLGATAATLITMQAGSFGARNNPTNLSERGTFEVGGERLPIEWQDIGGVSVMIQNPWQLAIGMGPGLWQYYENPWDHAQEFLAHGVGLDSVRPNLQLVARLCDTGLAGLYAMTAVLVLLYRHGKAGIPAPLRGEYLVTFALLLAMMQIPGAADQLTFMMLGAAVQVYRELGASEGAMDRMGTSTRHRRPESWPALVAWQRAPAILNIATNTSPRPFRAR